MTSLRSAAVVGATALATGAIAAPAGAADADRGAHAAAAPVATVSGGTTTLALGGLRAAAGTAVRVTALGGASGRGTTVALPVAGGALSAHGTVAQRTAAGLALRADGRTLRLTAFQLALGPTPRLTAKAGRGRVALFALSRSPLTSVRVAAPAAAPAVAAPAALATRAASTTTLATRSAQLRLTPAGARLLRSQLRLKRLPRGVVGTLRLQLRTTPAPVAPSGDAPTPPAPTTPAPAVPQAPAPQPPAPEPPAPVFPTPDPGSVLIPGLPSAQVVGGAAAWSFRGSWLRYVANGGGSVALSGGVAKDADAAYVYPVSGGSYDATAGWSIGHGGTVTFLYPSHGIEIALGDPRVELGSRAVLDVLLTNKSSASAGAPGEVDGDGVPRRVDFATLDLSAIVPQRDGATVTWTDVPVLLTAAGAEPFLTYRVGESFGSITIRATVAGA